MIPYPSSIEDLGRIVQYFEESFFSADDLLDAFAVFNYLGLREVRRATESAFLDLLADRVQDSLNLDGLDAAKNRANIKSAFDLRDLGRSLVAIEFADF